MNEPLKVDQTVFGEQGNCQSACLAMLLGLPIEAVPNFSAVDGNDFQKILAQSQWLHKHGWGIISLTAWKHLDYPCTKGYYIAGGKSPRGLDHAVLYYDGAIFHDPHPDRGGISTVESIDLLYLLRPFDLAKARKRFANQRRELRRLNAQISHHWPMMLHGMTAAEGRRVRVAMMERYGAREVLEALAEYDRREIEQLK